MSSSRGLRGVPRLVVLTVAVPTLACAAVLCLVSFEKYGFVSLLLAVVANAVTLSCCGFALRQRAAAVDGPRVTS